MLLSTSSFIKTVRNLVKTYKQTVYNESRVLSVSFKLNI
jgi:hypothetical protein